jgi:hypothetical protein
MFSKFLDWGNLGVGEGVLAVGIILLAVGFYLAKR